MAEDFDPTAYLKAKLGTSTPEASDDFDPSAYLADKGIKPKAVDPRFVDDEPPAHPFSESAQNYNANVDQLQADRKGQPDKVAPYGLSGVVSGQTQQPDRGKLDAFTRSLNNPFGLGPLITAGADKAVSLLPGQEPVDFSQRRQAIADANDAAARQHPVFNALGAIPRTAGEIATGGAVGKLAALGAPATAATLESLAPTAKLAASGFGYGAASGAGEAVSHGKSLPEIVDAGTKAGLVGATVGGVLGKLGSSVASKAGKNADDWMFREVLGDDAKTQATPTIRQLATNDRDDIVATLAKPENKELKTLIQDARGGNPEHLEELDKALQPKIANVFSERPALNAKVDEVKPMAVGDLVDTIKNVVKTKYGKTGFAANRNALNGMIEELQEFEGQNTKKVIDAKANPAIADAVKSMEKQVDAATSPAVKARVQGKIDELLAEHGQDVTAYDPKKPLSYEDLRDLVTRKQDDVASSMGTINATVANRRAREIMKPVYDFMETHLDAVAKDDPKLVQQIRDMNQEGSALLNIQRVTSQRLIKAEQNGNAIQKLPASLRGMLNIVGHGSAPLAVAEVAMHGHPIVASGIGAVRLGMYLKPILDTKVADLIRMAAAGSTRAQTALAVIKQAPNAAALLASHSATLRDVPHNAVQAAGELTQ